MGRGREGEGKGGLYVKMHAAYNLYNAQTMNPNLNLVFKAVVSFHATFRKLRLWVLVHSKDVGHGGTQVFKGVETCPKALYMKDGLRKKTHFR